MEETNHYIAKEGYTYKRKIDGFIMGNELYLGKFIDGTDDVIDNYEEVVDEAPKEETHPIENNFEEMEETEETEE